MASEAMEQFWLHVLCDTVVESNQVLHQIKVHSFHRLPFYSATYMTKHFTKKSSILLNVCTQKKTFAAYDIPLAQIRRVWTDILSASFHSTTAVLFTVPQPMKWVTRYFADKPVCWGVFHWLNTSLTGRFADRTSRWLVISLMWLFADASIFWKNDFT